jgi:hypothetical protein
MAMQGIARLEQFAHAFNQPTNFGNKRRGIV